jgi:rubredoxin-NAD+ reductase
MNPIIIIGSGLAGYSLAREFRRLDKETPLTIITQDDGAYYSKPQLSSAFTHHKTAAALALVPAEKMAQQLNATLLTHTKVIAISPEKKQITTQPEGIYPYHKLILAQGAETICLPITGNAANQIYYVNSLADYRQFRDALANVKHIAIIGAGLIGCEFANDLCNAGYQISMVALDKTPLERLLPTQVGLALQQALEQQGVNWHLQTTVTAIDKATSGYQLTLTNGKMLTADLVLSAVGLKPHTQLAQIANLQINRGIVVNAYLQSSDPNIYALGDCAEVSGILLFYLAPLFQSARALAQTLAGHPTAVHYPAMPVIIKTPACPISVCPPPINVSGHWQIEQEGNNVRALFYTENQQLYGFALAGEYTKDSVLLAKQIPDVLVNKID